MKFHARSAPSFTSFKTAFYTALHMDTYEPGDDGQDLDRGAMNKWPPET
jgi:hypothetical protein